MTNQELKTLYTVGGAAVIAAMAANVLDVALGFGSGETVAFGTKTAVEWFGIFNQSAFTGLYTLGILNIVYQLCMIPTFAALFVAHFRRGMTALAAISTIVFFIGVAIYISGNAAIPMSVLSGKYAAAGSEAQRAIIAAAGESVLAGGEDFTPGSFLPLILQGLAALAMAFVILRGGVFKKITGWIGLIAFALLSTFTVLATFVPSSYAIAFYGFGMLGGLFVLVWFVLIAGGFFRLTKSS